MERVFAMPDLGEGLEEGRVVGWLVQVGDVVALNQPVVEVETAKAVVEVPSPFAGTIVTRHGETGDEIAVGAPLITFEVEAVPAVAPDTDRDGLRTVSIDAPEALVERMRGAPAKATPPVRKRAKELGVDIDVVLGSGHDGRVTEEDVERFAARTDRSGAEGVLAVAVHQDLGSRLEPVGAIRREIAGALTRQTTIPQATTFRTIECTALEDARRVTRSSPLPFVIAALCRIVRDHPIINAAWLEDVLEYRDTINVGVAVDTERGLLVPVVQDAGRRGLADLTAEISRLASAARADSLALEDKLAHATIAVSNTGSYGSEAGTPILSPGTSVTLAFGAIQPRALVIDEQVVARPAATISCTFDHRVLDGAAAGRALTHLVSLLESRERLEGLPR